MARLVAANVVGQALLVGHELLPGDVAGVRASQTHLPLGDGDLHGSGACRPRPMPAWILAPAPIDVGPSIGRVLEDVAHPRAVSLVPDNLVRVQDDRAGAVMGQSSRDGQAQLAPRRFLAFPLVQAHPDLVQLCLAHDAGQAQEQAVVVGARIVEAFAIGNEHPKQGAQLEQLMPVAVVACEPGGVEADDQARVAEPDLGDELLETSSFGAPRTGLAEILVDDVDPLARPAEPDGAVDQAVLKLGALVMVPDLVDGGLAHIDVGEPGAVGCAQPLLRSVRSGQHAGSPRSWGCSPACGAATRQELGRSVLASRPAGSARAAAGLPESKWTLETQHDAGTV